MDSNSSIRIEKLHNDNFHTWKTRIQLFLALKEAHFYLFYDLPASNSPSYSERRKGDLKAKAIICLTLSEEHLEQVQHASSTGNMRNLISDIYEKHTLLNKLAARRRFFTAKMLENEKAPLFCSSHSPACLYAEVHVCHS